MNLKEAEVLLTKFLCLPEEQIIKDFSQLNGAIRYGKNEFSSVFVPGNRPDRALLVAHSDTVWLDSPHIKIGYADGIYRSLNRFRGLEKKAPKIYGYGIGADDRAGIALLWLLRNSGHSILVTSGEECGCYGSQWLMANEELARKIQEHQFAIEVDRKGHNDLVFYNISTPEFEKYCIQETGYIKTQGSFSDICVLCEMICGVNISAGFHNEHTCNEILNVRHWIKTANVLTNWLGKNHLPKFNLYAH